MSQRDESAAIAGADTAVNRQTDANAGKIGLGLQGSRMVPI
jgi:hypothetical protein